MLRSVTDAGAVGKRVAKEGFPHAELAPNRGERHDRRRQQIEAVGPALTGPAACCLLLLTQFAAAAAPADHYFGKLKMSALHIRYETMQLKKRYETHLLLPDQTLHLLVLTEDAYQDWARRYPADSWLPSTGYAIALLYAELPGMQARDRAVALLTYVKSHFPKTPYAAKSRAALHRGISVKPEPAWAIQTPSPSPSAAPSASPLPSRAASPPPTPPSRSPKRSGTPLISL